MCLVSHVWAASFSTEIDRGEEKLLFVFVALQANACS